MIETTDMTAIIAKAIELNNSMTEVNKELKRLASVKCRLKKMPGRTDFNANMTAVLTEEQLVKNVRDYLTGPRKNINNITADEVAAMDYDQVCRSIKCIQTKKTHTKYGDDCTRNPDGTFIPGSGESYLEACRIEDMLQERKAQIQPVGTGHIRKSDLLNLLESMKLASDLDVTTCIERIEAFLKGGE